MKTVLIADDDEKLRFIIELNLNMAGYQVVSATNGVEALRAAREHEPDLIILDVMMPQMDGLTVCRTLREEPGYPDSSILFLTARDQLTDKGLGFDAGGDDYLVKPFAPQELLWRCEALLRRLRRPALVEHERVCGRLRLLPATYEVEVDGERRTLTRIEFLLLSCLADAEGEVVPNGVLQLRVWGHEDDSSLAALRVHVNRLRQSLEPDPGAPRFVRTVRGRGYQLVPD
ncbi:MAG: response regulator transcription factor [Candidatus Sericytochromatia bacterium]|nr:response regulator transcription factor [Candidatus Sericytochromatia bacterium]